MPLCVVVKRSHAQSMFEFCVSNFELLPQKSSCIDSFMNRADSTDVGVSHAPFGMNAWL